MNAAIDRLQHYVKHFYAAQDLTASFDVDIQFTWAVGAKA